jgi:hypothetical protein
MQFMISIVRKNVANSTKVATHYTTDITRTYFHWGLKSLKEVVKSLGYKWIKCKSER